MSLTAPNPRGRLLRFGVAVLASALALLITWLLVPYLERGRFTLFFAAVMVSAWYGGRGPGILAALLSVVVAEIFLFTAEATAISDVTRDVVPLATFLLVAVGTSALTGRLRTARREADERAGALSEANARLQDQATRLARQVDEARSLSRELELSATHLTEETEGKEQALALLDTIFARAPIGLAFWDPSLRFQRVNDALAAMDRIPVDEHIGRELSELFPRASPRVLRALHGVLETGRPIIDMELAGTVSDADGRPGSWLASLFPVRTADGRTLGLGGVIAEVTERKRAADALRESEARFRQLADTAPVLIWMSDTEAGFEFFNETWLAFTGRAVEDERGSGWTAGVHPEDAERSLDAYRTAFDARESFRVEYRLRRSDGNYCWLLCTGVPRLTPRGEFAGYIGTCIDITERRLIEEERSRLLDAERVARAEAEAASRAKSEFLAMMSHELRTPLNAIGGYTDLLDLGVHGPLTAAQRADLSRVKRSQQHLLALIDNVLNFTRMEGGEISLEIVDIPVHEALDGLDALILPQLQAKGLRFELQGNDRDVLVRADPGRLQQIVINLMVNAVKFTDRGGTIAVRWDARGDTVSIAVADTGLGIPPEQLDAIFEPFVQVERGFTRRAEGAGLGLSISRRLARAMGGDITVESQPGGGSTFTVTLLRAPRSAPPG
ncbi:MAG: ATP-binding protein [Gemmatimonadaceae bacterium]